MSIWVDPFYKKMVDKLQVQIEEQTSLVDTLKVRLNQFDIDNPQAKFKASTQIGGISHYFTGAITRKHMNYELTQERSKLSALKVELKTYKALLEKSKQVA